MEKTTTTNATVKQEVIKVSLEIYRDWYVPGDPGEVERVEFNYIKTE